MSILDSTGLSYFYSKLKEKFIRSVNSQVPDATGNVDITNVATADNLTSPDAQTSYDYFIYRTSGGSASLSSGEAQLLYIDGNMQISGRVAENFVITATNGISATYNAALWRQQIASSGTYIFNYTKPTTSESVTSWTDSGNWAYGSTASINLSSYGLYVSNIINPSISIIAEGTGITDATIVPSTWSTQFAATGTYVFTYNQPDGGSANWYYHEEIMDLETYGITITGTPELSDTLTITYINGTPDSTLTVVYTAPEQGTISIATPTGFSATGFNQFDKDTMYIENATINEGTIVNNTGTYVCYCKAVGGVTNGYVAYSSSGHIANIGWCATTPIIGATVITTGSTVTSTLSSVTFDTDGYVVVVVNDMSDLCVHPKWSGSADEEYAEYVAPSVIQFPTTDIEDATIPIGEYGIPAVGAVADRLNLDAGTYIQKIGRLANTTANMNYVINLGTAYEYDNNYIFYVLPSPVTYIIFVDPIYIVNDWGTEEFLNTLVPVGAQTLYGQNLRDKLRTDVLTISQQTLTETQKSQVAQNIGIPSAYTSVPTALGTASAGSSTQWSRGDHVHNMPDYTDVGALSKATILWQNANPSSSFGEQTITVPNLSEYDWIIIGYSDGNDTEINSFEFCPNIVGFGTYAARIVGVPGRRLTWIRSNNQIYFSSYSGDNNNNGVKPEIIYGRKE